MKRVVADYAIEIQISTHVLNYVRIPKFDSRSKLHQRLANLGVECHSAAAKDDRGTLAALEAETDEAAAKLWGITDDELRVIQESLAETSESNQVAAKHEDDDV